MAQRILRRSLAASCRVTVSLTLSKELITGHYEATGVLTPLAGQEFGLKYGIS